METKKEKRVNGSWQFKHIKIRHTNKLKKEKKRKLKKLYVILFHHKKVSSKIMRNEYKSKTKRKFLKKNDIYFLKHIF